jgi:hypothetical protein
MNRTHFADANHIVMFGTELLSPLIEVMGGNRKGATRKAVGCARTFYLDQAMIRSNFQQRAKCVSNRDSVPYTVSILALTQPAILHTLKDHDSVMKELWEPASRLQQSSHSSAMGSQGQDSRLFFLVGTKDTSVVLPGGSSQPLASRSSSGAALSPDIELSSKSSGISSSAGGGGGGGGAPKNRRVLMESSREDCIKQLDETVVAKLCVAIVYAWERLPTEQNTKSPMFATICDEDGIHALNSTMKLIDRLVVKPAERLSDVPILTCIQRLSQEMYKKLTFAIEMFVFVIELAYRAPLCEDYCELVAMAKGDDWWHKLTTWSSSLPLEDLNISAYVLSGKSVL